MGVLFGRFLSRVPTGLRSNYKNFHQILRQMPVGVGSRRSLVWKSNNRGTISFFRPGPDNHPAAEKKLATLMPGPLACCRWELEQRRMIPPSNFALRIIIEEDSKLVRLLNAHYVDAERDGGLETGERDALFDVIGKHFTGRPWPRSGGMDATRRFMADLQSAMTETRWKVDLLAMA